MKRYLAFAGFVYYPNKGMEDFIGDYDDLEQAATDARTKAKEESSYSWYQVYDTITKTIVVDEVVDRNDD